MRVLHKTARREYNESFPLGDLSHSGGGSEPTIITIGGCAGNWLARVSFAPGENLRFFCAKDSVT